MSHATLDRVLAVLVVAMATTGLLSLRAGAADQAWVFTLHAVLGGSLLAATVVKLRRSALQGGRAGRWPRLALASLVSLGVVAALTGGFLWVASGELLTVGTWTVLTLHAWVGLLVVPLVALHLLPRRWRLLRPPPRHGISRRAVIAAGGLGLAGIGLFGLASLADRLRGGVRRFTGSRWLPTGGIPPVTTFFGEGTPSIDPDAWRLTVATPSSTGSGRSMPSAPSARPRSPRSWIAPRAGRSRPAGVACRSPWLLDATEPETWSARGRVLVKSVTGWSRRPVDGRCASRLPRDRCRRR